MTTPVGGIPKSSPSAGSCARGTVPDPEFVTSAQWKNAPRCPAAKAAVDTGGGSAVSGLRHFVADMAAAPRVPSMVDNRFVLSTSGHGAAMVNPPGNDKARYQVAKGCAGLAPARSDLPRHLVAGLRGLAGRALR